MMQFLKTLKKVKLESSEKLGSIFFVVLWAAVFTERTF